MDKWLLVFSILCMAASVVFTVYSYWKNKEQAQRIKRMIDTAIEGTFRESGFDETVLSQVESRLAEYLKSNEVAQGRLSEERDKIKELISDISHQTKTPIANILLYGELLQELDVPKEAQEYVEQLLKQSGKLQTLIDDLVKLSRLETGILKLQPQQESVQDMLADIIADYMPKAEEKGLMLRFLPMRGWASADRDETLQSIPTDVDVDGFSPRDMSGKAIASFDRKWTQEAVSNIVDNAIKYTESGSVEISVREFELFVAIDIRDTGIGVPQDEQAEIFGRFYRGKNVCSQDGVGIGLYLAREIVSDQGGYIKLSSDDQGSTFSVFLPRERA